MVKGIEKKAFIYILVVFLFSAGVGGFFIYESTFSTRSRNIASLSLNYVRPNYSDEYSENDRFRNSVIKFVRRVGENYLAGQSLKHPKKLQTEGDWQVNIVLYSKGEIKGKGVANKETLSLALEEAIKNTLNGLIEEELREGRFLVSFSNASGRPFSFIEYKEEGKELINKLVVVRKVDKDLILQKIEKGKDFLFRVEHKDEHGFYKKYDAPRDYFENRLHTVYSASIVYTFLYLNDFERDERILESLPRWGNFLLSMQNKEKGRAYGAFHYSYYLDSREKELQFPVGTSALSVFTLLRLHEITGEEKYLESAKLAGNWLTTMQKPDGSVKSTLKYRDEKWFSNKKESLLYNGQVLSALSKLYRVTGQQKYYETAKGIARHFAEKYEKEQGYIKGEYRKKNPISNAWVVMSLMDFYNNADQNEGYKRIIFELGEKILENQIIDEEDLLDHGRWKGAYSTSGNGWLSEVMVETYKFCKEQNRNGCDKYKDAVVRVIRWLIQGTYSEENSFFLKNPEMAIGGLFWDERTKYVRTDSVCHGLNGYVRIINDLEDGLLLYLPEKPLKEILGGF